MTDSTDSFDLERFVAAQDDVWPEVLGELAAGAKRTHWMWFVFPQLRGLGRSATAQHFGIASLAEAEAYARHPVLWPRLRRCAGILRDLQGRTALEVFGPVDELKLRSCLTLFERAEPGEPLFAALLDRYFAGERDRATLALLQGAS
jgi:uncharacterized protein (DUF1810 family)